MAAAKVSVDLKTTSAEEQTSSDSAPSVDERKGMRAHDADGNIRPADGRWPLHKPEDESEASQENS